MTNGVNENESLDGVVRGQFAYTDLFTLVTAGAIVITITVVVLVLRYHIRWTVKCPSDERIDGKTIIITGASSGLGRATALELARRGGRVVLAGRNEKKTEAVARQIRSKSSNPNVFAMRLDLASLASVREFVHEFQRAEPRLHILINNAAYMGPRATTEDGLERSFGVNYLGHFYLTYLLVDRLKLNAPSRIINVVSDSITQARLDLDDLQFAGPYNIYAAYARSKLCLALMTLHLHRKYIYDTVACIGIHPGAVNTDLMRHWPGVTGSVLRLVARLLFKSPTDGCQSIVHCAVASDAPTQFSGTLVRDCAPMVATDRTKDRDLQDRLWQTSLRLCGVDESAMADET